MSWRFLRGQLASAGGLSAPAEAGARCGRRRAAKSSVGGVVGCQGGLAHCCEEVSVWCGAAEWAKTRGPTCRLGRGSCNTCALGASSARTEGVRYNAVACYRSQVRLASNRTRLQIEGNSRDKVVWSGDQVHNVDLKSCQIWLCTQGV